MLPLRAFALVAPLALAGLGSAQTVLLRFKPPVGTKVNYTTVMSMVQGMPGGMGSTSFTQTLPMTYRIVSRAGTLTTVETKLGQVKVTMPPNSPMARMKDQMEKASSGTTTKTTVDELGNLKGMAAGGSGAAMASQMSSGMIAGAQGVSYPAKAMKVGESWKASLDIGKMLGGGMPGAGMKASGNIPIVYRLVSVEKRGGKTLARISLSMKGATTMTMASPGGPGGGNMSMKMNMNSTGSILIDTATGLLQSMTNTSDTVMNVMGQNMKQHTTMTMKAN